jgi:acetylornithine deacetylase/succinyl-diaminopimelate desuccinylase-like protein
MASAVRPSQDPRLDWRALSAEAVEHLKALLRIDTTNPPGNERPAADYLAAVLDREGIEYRIVESLPTRASLVARLPGSGKKAPLLLNGHLDVVPADPERWRHDPFTAEEHDGCIWGRGAIDMKNMVVMSLMALVVAKRLRIPLERDLVFAAVADEEAGSTYGARFLVEQHPELVRAEYVLNEVGGYTYYFGDTVFYPVQVAEKGICWFELVAEGEPGHGSVPRPDNAVVKIGKAIEALGRVRLPEHVIPVVDAFLRRLAESASFPTKQAMPLLLKPKLAGMLLSLMQRSDADQASAINALLRNTASPTMLAGGKKINVIPSIASVKVDGRIIPGQTVDSFLAEIQRVIGPGVRVNVLDSHEGAVFDANTPLFDAISRGIERNHPGAVAVPFMIPGFTDSHAYKKLGATCYGFAPVRMPAGINFSRLYHGHDERIPRDGFEWGTRVLYEVVADFACGVG